MKAKTRILYNQDYQQSSGLCNNREFVFGNEKRKSTTSANTFASTKSNTKKAFPSVGLVVLVSAVLAEETAESISRDKKPRLRCGMSEDLFAVLHTLFSLL
jgi:hypothetical protein